MSIYGESSNQFRPRPSIGVVAIFTCLATLIGVEVGPLLFSLARTLATRAIRSDYLFNVHAPLAANPSLGLFPLHSDQIVTTAAIAAGGIALLSTLFVAVYPASQNLANRLALYSVGTAILATGSIATVADLGILRSVSRWKDLSELASGAAIGTWVLVVLIALVWLERRTVSLLGNVFEIGSPLQRLGLWALRVPLPWGSFAAICYLSDWWGGVIAAGGVILVTMIDDLVHYPNLRYETLDRPKMHEGLAAVLIVAVIVTGGSIWAFGFPVAGLIPRAITWDGKTISRVPVMELTNRIQEETMPRIEMKWSNENDR